MLEWRQQRCCFYQDSRVKPCPKCRCLLIPSKAQATQQTNICSTGKEFQVFDLQIIMKDREKRCVYRRESLRDWCATAQYGWPLTARVFRFNAPPLHFVPSTRDKENRNVRWDYMIIMENIGISKTDHSREIREWWMIIMGRWPVIDKVLVRTDIERLSLPESRETIHRSARGIDSLRTSFGG